MLITCSCFDLYISGLDADKINEIIKKASEGSRFYQHKQKCQQRLDGKIAEMMKAKAAFSEQQINKAIIQVLYMIVVITFCHL